MRLYFNNGFDLHRLHRRFVFAVIDRDFTDNFAYITEQHIHLVGDRIGHPPARDRPHPRHAADPISRLRAPPQDPVKIAKV